MAVLESILLLAVLISAGGILLAKGIRMAVGMYMAFSLLLALLWGVLYGPRLAVTEVGVGVVVTGLLLYFSMRKLREEKGSEHESKKS